jgi:hypothetical protein
MAVMKEGKGRKEVAKENGNDNKLKSKKEAHLLRIPTDL